MKAFLKSLHVDATARAAMVALSGSMLSIGTVFLAPEKMTQLLALVHIQTSNPLIIPCALAVLSSLLHRYAPAPTIT